MFCAVAILSFRSKSSTYCFFRCRLNMADSRFRTSRARFFSSLSSASSEVSCLSPSAAGLSGASTSGSTDTGKASEAEQEFDAACVDFTKVLSALPEEKKEEPKKEAKKEEPKKEGDETAETAEPEPSMKAQVLVMWGNTLFEHSQMRARLGKEWRSLLDDAVVKFKDAGCAQADIHQALKVHRGVRAEAK